MIRVVILTGTSGSSKTAVTEAIGRRSPDLAEVLHFDRIGFRRPARWQPDGSGEARQCAATLAGMARIAAMTDRARSVLVGW